MESEHGRSRNHSLENHDAVLHACGGNKDVVTEVLRLFDESLETGLLSVPRERCEGFLTPLEEAEGEREGKDRGSYRLLKAITVFARLRGYSSRDSTIPIREINVTGNPLLSFSTPSRAGAGGKVEPVVRSLELVVHLARTSIDVTAVKLGKCDLGPEGGDKCMTEVVRLVRRMGIGSYTRFLEEVDLSNNAMDADSVRKIVEAAVKERCEIRGPPPTAPLWLDMSGNVVKNPDSIFKNLQAWAGWAHNKENALCLASSDECTRKTCCTNSLLHMPRFLDQNRPEAPKAPRETPQRVAPALPVRRELHPARIQAPKARRSRSRRGRRERSPPRLELRPGPGVSARRRSRSRPRHEPQSRPSRSESPAGPAASPARESAPGSAESAGASPASPAASSGSAPCTCSAASDVESDVSSGEESADGSQGDSRGRGHGTPAAASGDDSSDAERSCSDRRAPRSERSPRSERARSERPQDQGGGRPRDLGQRLDRLLESLKSQTAESPRRSRHKHERHDRHDRQAREKTRRRSRRRR